MSLALVRIGGWHAGSMMSMTNFSISDIVCCDHEIGHSCFACAGRLVHNVPLLAYNAWCQATRCNYGLSDFDLAYPAPVSESLAYPASVSLAAFLAPGPADHILHVNSGRACIAASWALLFPGITIACLEGSLGLHHVAAGMLGHVDISVQQRIHLHQCNPLSTAGDWSAASILLVSADVFDETSFAFMTSACEGLRPGTRVVLLSHRSFSSALSSNFALIHDALYRTERSCYNIKVSIFVKM